MLNSMSRFVWSKAMIENEVTHSKSRQTLGSYEFGISMSELELVFQTWRFSHKMIPCVVPRSQGGSWSKQWSCFVCLSSLLTWRYLNNLPPLAAWYSIFLYQGDSLPDISIRNKLWGKLFRKEGIIFLN
jgi:hypothetical protein